MRSANGRHARLPDHAPRHHGRRQSAAARATQDGRSRPAAEPPACGNGKLDPGEDCDGARGTCPTARRACRLHLRGSAEVRRRHVDTGEQCDDGNTSRTATAAHATCQPEVCGDGITDGGEQCDDGNTIAGDGCSRQLPDRALRQRRASSPGEQCDDGAQRVPLRRLHRATCQLMPPATCGNGTVDPGETCDDGNQTDCDGCSQLLPDPSCGDGNVRRAPSSATTATPTSNDGCSATCQLEVCGDHIVQSGEECDDGAQNGVLGDACSTTCPLHWCGDGTSTPTSSATTPTRTCATAARPIASPRPRRAPSAAPDRPPRASLRRRRRLRPLRACGATTCVRGRLHADRHRRPATTATPAPVDACDPARGCVQTPKTCEDGNACNGVSTCDPASGACVARNRARLRRRRRVHRRRSLRRRRHGLPVHHHASRRRRAGDLPPRRPPAPARRRASIQEVHPEQAGEAGRGRSARSCRPQPAPARRRSARCSR